MDSRYIKRLFGNNYHGFNYKEAEKNLDMSFDVFNSRIRKIGGEVKISADVKLEPIYWFTLFCYYNWFGYNIKVVKAPEFCNFLRVYYAFTETEEITIKGKPADIYGNEKKLGKKKGGIRSRTNCHPIQFNNKQKINVINIFGELLRMPNNAIFIIDRYMNDLNVKDAEVKVVKDYLPERTIARQIAVKLEKLYICLFPILYEGKGFTTGDLIPDHRRDIMNILTAFGLTNYKRHPDLLKNHQHLLNDENIFPAPIYPKGEVFIHSGEDDDFLLLEFSKEKILEAIANSK